VLCDNLRGGMGWEMEGSGGPEHVYTCG